MEKEKDGEMIGKHPQIQEKDSAQGLVEFALILPILLLLVIGIIEVGRLLFFYSSVTSASREGARYGSAVGEVADNEDRYEDCDGIQAAALRAGAFAGLETDDIVIQYDNGVTVTHNACPPTGEPRIILGDRVVVTANGNFRPVVPLLAVFFPEAGLDITSTTARTIIKSVAIKGTPEPTDTPPVGATSTPTPTDTPTPTPTDTPTPTPTDTPTPTPTYTNTPEPTATNTPQEPPVCSVTVSLDFIGSGKVTWVIENTGNKNIRLQELRLKFPDGDDEFGNLLSIAFEDPIWEGELDSPADIARDEWKEPPEDRNLLVNQSKYLGMNFFLPGVGESPSQLDVYFESLDGTTCSVRETWRP